MQPESVAHVVVHVDVVLDADGPERGGEPVDLARAGTPAAAVGFVNAMGYLGAFAGDLITGTLVDRSGWEVAIWFWAVCAFAAAGFVAMLWRVSRPPEYDST